MRRFLALARLTLLALFLLGPAFGQITEPEKLFYGFEMNGTLPERVYLLDNNNFSGYAFLLATIPLEEGTTISIKVFHPSSMQLLPLQIKVGAKEAIELGEAEVECTVCELVIAGTPLKLWVDEQGRIRRETEAGGRLVVELQ